MKSAVVASVLADMVRDAVCAPETRRALRSLPRKQKKPPSYRDVKHQPSVRARLEAFLAQRGGGGGKRTKTTLRHALVTDLRVKAATAEAKQFFANELLSLNDDDDGGEKPEAIDDISQCVQKIYDDNPDLRGADINVTGHSLGGALSSLCAFELANKFPDVKVYNYSFASPRVGGATWRDAFQKQPNLIHYRIGTSGDTVTSVPSVNYYHAETWAIVLNSDGKPTMYGPDEEYTWWSAYAFWSNLRPDRHFTSAYWDFMTSNNWGN